MILVLKPFGPVDREVLEVLRREIPLFDEVRIGREAPIPASAYDPRRRQYRASGFFPLAEVEDATRVLGVTEADLYEEGLNFVFGYAQKPGRVAIVSIARLKGKGRGLLEERAVKEAIHELGHTLGLDHDERRPGCVMRFSRNVEDTDHKDREFCPQCRKAVELIAKRLRT